MTSIPLSELKQIRHIDVDNLSGRSISVMHFFDGESWDFWLPAENKLIWLDSRPAESDYLGTVPESEEDILLHFLNFMVQRACWPDTLRHIGAIRCDIHNLAASLAKFELFHSVKEDRLDQLYRFASTELEYIFVVCRSMFDLLQETISSLWTHIKIKGGINNGIHLPKSFRRMVIRDNQLMTKEEISERWKIPEVLANYYVDKAPFFEVLRSYRDEAIHKGVDSRIIFVTEEGFGIGRDKGPFESFDIWNKEPAPGENIVSLRPLLAHLVRETLRSCEEFSRTMQEICEFPPPIAPGFQLFVRGSHNKQLLQLDQIISDSLWWEH